MKSVRFCRRLDSFARPAFRRERSARSFFGVLYCSPRPVSLPPLAPGGPRGASASGFFHSTRRSALTPVLPGQVDLEEVIGEAIPVGPDVALFARARKRSADSSCPSGDILAATMTMRARAPKASEPVMFSIGSRPAVPLREMRDADQRGADLPTEVHQAASRAEFLWRFCGCRRLLRNDRIDDDEGRAACLFDGDL